MTQGGAKTAEQLRSDMRTMVISRTTDELIQDYKLGATLANSPTMSTDKGAAWIVTLGVIETELNERGIATCEMCGWPNGEHDPELCPAPTEFSRPAVLPQATAGCRTPKPRNDEGAHS